MERRGMAWKGHGAAGLDLERALNGGVGFGKYIERRGKIWKGDMFAGFDQGYY